MQLSVNSLYGDNLGALDGEIGHVKDLYFDDLNWTVRYLAIDTGSWLSGRQVLISPYSCTGLDQTGKIMKVNLSKNQIENCPPIENHRPVSRQFEVDFFLYYGLPFYWQGVGLWGMSGFPQSTLLPDGMPGKPAPVISPSVENADAHLRSTKAVNGYHIQAKDGAIGHISDFLMDDKDWSIQQLVVKTGGWLFGAEVLIPANRIERIVNEELKVHVDMTIEAIRQCPMKPQDTTTA